MNFEVVFYSCALNERKFYIGCVCCDIKEELRLIFGRVRKKNIVGRLYADHKSVKGASPEVKARLTF